MTPSPDTPLKIGTRASPLALAQAYEVRRLLMAAHDLPEAAFDIVSASTLGDRVQDRSLRELGGKGLFSKEIEDMLLAGEVDIAVHSTKDMAVEQPEGLILDVFLERENPFDALITPKGIAFTDLPKGARLGTSSLRRKAQALHLRPDLNVVEFRGSVQTRLQKLSEGVADATFLACAGLNRLGQNELTKCAMPEMLPAIAQGVISIECRADDAVTAALIAPLNHEDTAKSAKAERAFLQLLEGSCQAPIAGLAVVKHGRIELRGQMLSTDGQHAVSGQLVGDDPMEVGQALARQLLADPTAQFMDWR